MELFQESPTSFLQEMRKGKYIRHSSADKDVLHTMQELQLPVESSAGSSLGVTLLEASTVEQLLLDKRRTELVQPFKVSLLTLTLPWSSTPLLQPPLAHHEVDPPPRTAPTLVHICQCRGPLDLPREIGSIWSQLLLVTKCQA